MTLHYAHTSERGLDYWQPLKEHLTKVAELAGERAERFGACQYAYAAGLLHDLGKYSAQFQSRLKGKPLRVDHSTAGAQEALALYGPNAGTLLAYVVAGHHSGLPDFGSIEDPHESSLAIRLKKPTFDYGAFRCDELPFPSKNSLRAPVKPLGGQEGFSLQFFIRMLYSSLVDADFLDTESVMDGVKALARSGDYPSVSDLAERLGRHLETLSQTAADTEVNRQRAQILKACMEKALTPPGLFSLTVPTGGGKTLSSLAFALNHALRNGMDRVIYVIPFTSIIEQNAQVFRKVLGDEVILEHHSNFESPQEGTEEWSQQAHRLLLATENWDAPIIVTTNVQFFESLFANRSSRCRKLHNIARSVIILDEAQMLPTDYLKPCLAAISELVKNYGSSVVLCTATQPALGSLLPDAVAVGEIAPDPPGLYEALRRVEVVNRGEMDDSELIEELRSLSKVLCIVNTRAHARELYEGIRHEEGTFHLSALMCPRHRSKVLAEIRERLDKDVPCRVVSTQLIEAGVDVDFPVVYRSIAGLDSIAQAAGRCNREGKLASGRVFIFKPTGRRLRGWFQRTAAVAEMVLRNTSDPLGIDAVHEYFDRLYDLEGDGLDKAAIIERFQESYRQLAFPFAEIAEEFRVIDSSTVPIVIPYDEQAEELIGECRYHMSRGVLRRLQPYVVQVYPYEFESLQNLGYVHTIGREGSVICVLSEQAHYTAMGLELPRTSVPSGEAWFV